MYNPALNGIIDNGFGELKKDAVRLGCQPDDVPGNSAILQYKDLLDLFSPEFIAYGFLITDSLSHENGLRSCLVKRKHK